MMRSYEQTVRAFRRRLLFGQMARRLGVALLAASLIALIALIAERSFGLKFNPWWYAIGAGLASGIAIVWSLVRHPSMDDAARVLDLRLRTKNRFGTARWLEREADAFAELIRRDADRRAAGLDLRRAGPIRFGASAGWALVVAGLFLTLFVWMPAFDVLGRKQRELARNQLSERVVAARRQVDEAATTIQSLSEDAPAPGDGVTNNEARARDTLERLAEQLGRSDESPSVDDAERVDDLIAEASSELESLADELEREAAQNERALDELRDRFAGISPSESGPTRDFTDLLRQGRFGEAAESLRDAVEQAEDTEERREIAQDLERLAEQLDRSRSIEQSKREAEEEALADRLRRQSLTDEQIEQFLRDPDEDALRDALENAGADSQDAEEEARASTREAEDLEARRQAENELEQTARDLSRVADDLESESSDAAEDEGAPDPTDDQSDAAPGERDAQIDPGASDSEDEADPGENESTGSDAADAQQDAADEQPSTRTDEQDSGRSEPTPTPSEEGDDGQRSTEPTPVNDDSREGQQSEATDDEVEGAESDRESGLSEEPQAEEGAEPVTAPDPAATKDSQGQDKTSQSDPTAAESEAVEEDGVDEPPSDRALEEALRRLSERRGEAERQREVSEELRERARRLAEQMSPEQREQIERWARQRAAEQESDPQSSGSGDPSGNGADSPRPFDPLERPYDLEELDLRDPDATEPTDDDYTVLAEWLRDQNREAAPGIDEGEARESVRRAAEATERALNEESIGPRYRDLIRRWADRLPETLEKATTPRESEGADPGS